MKLLSTSGAVLLPFASLVSAIQFKADDSGSIKSCSQQYAHGLMSYYEANATDLPKEQIGIFPEPHYWWEAGAVWGGLIEFTQFTGDQSYVKTIQQALTANYGPNNDVILPWKKAQEGNDDQAFWCLATMSALEYQFPEPDAAPASYLEITQNCFNNIVSRWDTSSCGGGLKWQIYPENDYGYNYKNSISNGATFALGARLARYTGNQTYADWASKIYDWTKEVGLIGDDYEVYDGTDDKTGCKEVADKTEWTYNNAMFLHGSAFLYDYTKGDKTWKKRTEGFLDHASTFFENPKQAEDVMFEVCENSQKGCNLDQQSFKAYLARWMAKTAILVPDTKDKVTTYLTKSAEAAAKACSGGDDGVSCGAKWYEGGFDGQTGVGQQLSAMEVTQALLMLQKGTVPSTGADQYQPKPSASSAPKSSVAPSSKAAPSAAPSSTAVQQPSAPKAPSSADSTPAPSTEAAPAPPRASSTPAAVESPAPSSPAAAPSSPPQGTNPGGQFGELKPSNATKVASCTSMRTTTVYVPPSPPTGAPVPPPSSGPVVPPPPSNTTTPTVPSAPPVAPPSNTTGPAIFPGAASSVNLAGSTLFVAAAIAALAALL